MAGRGKAEIKVTRSQELFERASKLMPGGVNSPVRAFRSVGRTPFFVEKAKGAYLYDADGNRYLDYVCSWGPGILGHAYPSVIEAVQKAVSYTHLDVYKRQVQAGSRNAPACAF